MTIRLRAHHVLCVLTFAGEGYTKSFIANLADVVARIGNGEPIELVDGPDDVCAPLERTDDHHCNGASVLRRDREALRAITGGDTANFSTTRSFMLDAAAVATLRVHFADGSLRAACTGCEWFTFCSDIAVAEFSPAVL